MKNKTLSQNDSRKDVNEILVKIEMKKFQKLIDNRIMHNNALLKKDAKRYYPLCKNDKK